MASERKRTGGHDHFSFANPEYTNTNSAPWHVLDALWSMDTPTVTVIASRGGTVSFPENLPTTTFDGAHDRPPPWTVVVIEVKAIDSDWKLSTRRDMGSDAPGKRPDTLPEIENEFEIPDRKAPGTAFAVPGADAARTS
jgi:hypothetical protein